MEVIKMSDYPDVPSKTVVNDSDTIFVPDYKYLPMDEVKNITVQQLKKLEADLHTLRLLFISNGENPSILISQNKTLGQEMKRTTDTIKKLESYFASVLK